MPFHTALKDRFGIKAADYAAGFVQKLGLPLPEHDEFYETNRHSGKLEKLILFLESHDVALRFYESFDIPRHDNILQPLAKKRFAAMDIDIVPLVVTGLEDDDARKLFAVLGGDGIIWSDCVPENAGYLNYPAKSQMVVVDVCDTLQVFDAGRAAIAGAPYQDYYYAELKQAAQDLFNGQRGLPPKRAAAAFFKACRAEMDDDLSSKMLHGYINTGDGYVTHSAVCSAEKYTNRVLALQN